MFKRVQYWSLLNWQKNAVPLRFRCDSCKLKCCRYFTMFAIFKNVIHILEPSETPSYIFWSLVRRGVSLGSKLCTTFLNNANCFKTVRCGCVAVALRLRLFFQFTEQNRTEHILYFRHSLHESNNMWAYRGKHKSQRITTKHFKIPCTEHPG